MRFTFWVVWALGSKRKKIFNFDWSILLLKGFSYKTFSWRILNGRSALLRTNRLKERKGSFKNQLYIKLGWWPSWSVSHCFLLCYMPLAYLITKTAIIFWSCTFPISTVIINLILISVISFNPSITLHYSVSNYRSQIRPMKTMWNWLSLNVRQ